LRALYFVLAGAMGKFAYLKPALSFILVFVGIKMLLPDASYALIGEKWKIQPEISLAVVMATLLIAVVASWLKVRNSGFDTDRPLVCARLFRSVSLHTPSKEICWGCVHETNHPLIPSIDVGDIIINICSKKTA